MRKVYQRRLPENPNKDYYYIIRETGVNTEPILVEYGFIDNTKDATKLKNNLLDYVEGVVKALAEYTNTPYTPPGTELGYYTVKKGDTLYSIANRYNIPVSTLKVLNNLTSDVLSVGQRLKLTSTSVIGDYETYVIKKGDTLYSIANQYKITADNLKKINNLTSNSLVIGQELKVPKTENTLPPINEEIDNYVVYTVQKGDSLWSISQKYNVSVDDIINANNLGTINLKVGDQLSIPTKQVIPLQKTYTVKSGDSFWSIAKSNNVSVDSLKQKNNLSSNLLTIGQILIIPN